MVIKPVFIEDIATKIDPKVLNSGSNAEVNELVFTKVKQYIFDYVIDNYFEKLYKRKPKPVEGRTLDYKDDYYRIKIRDQEYHEYPMFVMRKHYRLLNSKEIQTKHKKIMPIRILIGYVGLRSVEIQRYCPKPNYFNDKPFSFCFYSANRKELAAWELGMKQNYEFVGCLPFYRMSVEEAIKEFNSKKSHYIRTLKNYIGN